MNVVYSSFRYVAFALALIIVAGVADAQQETKTAAKAKAAAARAATEKNAKASSDDSGRKTAQRPTAKAIPVKLSIDQQDVALSFARKHHPELADLLEKLRKSSPEGFQRGIRSVHAAEQRLTRMLEKQPTRFDTELRNWKTDSQIRLLTARWAVSQNKKLEDQIQKLIRQRQEARLNQMKAERDRIAERLAQLDEKIGMGTADLEADLKAEWDQLKKRTTSSIRNRRAAGKRTARPAPKPAQPDSAARSDAKTKPVEKSQPTKAKGKSKSQEKTRAKESSRPTS